jgi:hypothetical protein
MARQGWRLGAHDLILLGATVQGIIFGAREMAPDPGRERWAGLRRQQLAAGGLRLTAGHLALRALPG